MVPLCAHIHPSGHTCDSPALRGQTCCYVHAKGRRPAGPRLRTVRPGYRWYSFQRGVHLLEPPEIPLALAEICTALVAGEIPRCRPGQVLKAIRQRGASLKTAENQACKRNRISGKLVKSMESMI
jgi:hypothetical protein